MSRKELLAYVREHPNDEAFYAYRDRINAEPRGESYSPLKSITDLQNFPEVIERFRQDGEKWKRS